MVKKVQSFGNFPGTSSRISGTWVAKTKTTNQNIKENIYETHTNSFSDRVGRRSGLDARLGVDQRSSNLPAGRRLLCFESQGYITDPSTGQTTIAFRVTNKCRNPVSYVAIGTGGFTRVAPADGSSYNGDLSIYDVAWTRAGGTPGFESVKFTPTLKNFANSASEMFNVSVSNFNPATMIMVRGKAGNAQETYNFLLSQTCGPPTPTRRIYWANDLEPIRSAGSI